MKTYEVTVNEEIKEWRMNGKLHREDGPAVELADGAKYWYIDGNLHREDGPAIEYANGTKYWFLHGKRHREDGPACEYVDGNKFWYLHGVVIAEADFFKRLHKDVLIQTLKQCQLNEDTENAHSAADRALLDYINDDEITELYNSIDKWYA